jgi:hypothetical protein
LYFEQPKHRARCRQIITTSCRDAGPPSGNQNIIGISTNFRAACRPKLEAFVSLENRQPTFYAKSE